MMTNVTAVAAVDEWVHAYRALQELEGEHAWFRPFMNAIASELLATATFGVKTRAYFGAAMSMLDLTTDAYIVIRYFNEGKD